MTPTARTLAHLRRLGYLAAVVESWVPIPGRKVRRDLWGIGDVLAVHPRDGVTLLVQCTSGDHTAHRAAKVCGTAAAAVLLRAGWRIEVWGWVQRAGRWEPRVVPITAEGLQVVAVPQPRRRGKRERGLFDGPIPGRQ